MSVTTPPTWTQTQFPPSTVRRFSVDEYHRMVEAGVLTENDPVELLEGWIVAKMPHNPTHEATIDQIDEVLRGQLPTGWRIRTQSVIAGQSVGPIVVRDLLV